MMGKARTRGRRVARAGRKMKEYCQAAWDELLFFIFLEELDGDAY